MYTKKIIKIGRTVSEEFDHKHRDTRLIYTEPFRLEINTSEMSYSIEIFLVKYFYQDKASLLHYIKSNLPMTSIPIRNSKT